VGAPTVRSWVGPELLRVKDLARRSNAPTTEDYFLAVKKALKRIAKRQDAAIQYRRSSAGREIIPLQTRPSTADSILDNTTPTTLLFLIAYLTLWILWKFLYPSTLVSA
jgi:hypothetical protein